MPTETLFMAALLLAVPILIKYLLAFQIHNLVERLKNKEREVKALFARLQAIHQEQAVVRRAMQQVAQQHQRAQVRRGLLEERLAQFRQR